MSSEFINKIGSKVILTVIVIVAYTYILRMGEHIAKFLGFTEVTIYQFIVIVAYSSILIFFITLVLNYMFQIIPFISKDSFVRTFYGMHMFFLYVSGLLVTLISIQPILIESGYLAGRIDNEISQVFILLFFIILSNYYVYDVIVIQDRLSLLKEGKIHLIVIYRVFLFVFSVSWIIRSLVVGFYDQVNVIWGFLIVAPTVINRVFFNNSDMSLD